MSEPLHSDRIQKVAPPAYLHQRLETFQMGKGGKISYVLRDRVLNKNYDFEAWQFFVLEVLPGCENFPRLATAFEDRFGRALTRKELENFFAQVAESKLFNEDAGKHPLLAPFCEPAYDVDDNKARTKLLPGNVTAGVAAWAEAPVAPKAETARKAAAPKDLLPGTRGVIGLDPQASKVVLGLFDPRPILKRIMPFLRPTRYISYLLPLLVIAALSVATYMQPAALFTSLGHLFGAVSTIGYAFIAVFAINVLATLTSACVAYAYRGTVSEIGVALYFGFLPGFAAIIGHTEQMSRRERMLLNAGPLFVRLTLLSIGTLLWYFGGAGNGALPGFGLALALVCALDLIFLSGNPAFKGRCYHMLSAFLDQGNLRGGAIATLVNRLRGNSYQKTDSDALTAYAIAIGVHFYVLLCLALTMVGNGLKSVQISGSAIILIVALGIYLFSAAVGRIAKVNEAYERSLQLARWKDRTVVAGETEAAAAAVGKAPLDYSAYARRAVPLIFLVVMFLPYTYEPGGVLTAYPNEKVEIAPDVQGIVSEVNFDGGEFVKKGTPIARIKDDDNYAELQKLIAQVAEQQAVVDNLKTLPKPEAIKLAQADVQIASTREQFSREKEPRIHKLYKVGAVSFDEYDAVKKEHDVDVDDVAQKLAQLALVKTGPTADEIAAAEAKVDALKAARDDYQDKVNRSVLYMPFDGQIMTLHLKDKINTFLEKGKVFCAVEDSTRMTAEIDVPEQEIAYAAVGKKVRVRPQAYNEEDFDGVVATIDPSVTVQPSGNIVKVIAVINNPEGKLKSGMTGYGKIYGVTMPVWKAFSLAILNFVNVDVWSWIP